MKTFQVINKTYVKSTNKTSTIIARYNYSLIAFTILTIIINLFLNNKELVIELIKNIVLSLIITSVVTYLINVIKKNYSLKKIFLRDTTIAIAIIMAFININTNIYLLVSSIIVTLVIKNIKKNINLSSVLYGILLILLYKYFTNNLETPLTFLKDNNYQMTFKELLDLDGGIYNYLFSIKYLSPVLSIIMFIYLFYKKGIKYNLVISYTLTIFIITFIYGALTNKLWFGLFELITGSLLFLTVYALTDYEATPTIGETQTLYGIALGIMTAILRFIIPEFAIVIPLIVGELLLSNLFDKLSYKLKTNRKQYNLAMIVSITVIIITIVTLKILI